MSEARLRGIQKLLASLSGQDPFDVEEAYVELFDRGRATSLHLFEHVHGDSRDRGPAMIDLIKTYEQAGLLLDPAKVGGELPDYLPVVLEFISTLKHEQMCDFIGEIEHILNAVHTALLKRHSLYAHVLGAVLEIGQQQIETVQIPDDEDLDAAWAEPEALPAGAPKDSEAPISLNPSRSCGVPHRPINEEHQHEPLTSVHFRHLSLHLRSDLSAGQPAALRP